VSYADWLRARSARLLGPALIFLAEPALGVLLLAAGALLLRVNPVSPLLRSSQPVG
jgi:hypothetical protein